ncbi:MAG TPA: hypothetical protein VNM66_03615 [Thermodesulfobacteriota bacterium]|nr:hypothetical protein [Thermodesulfobacteriota bacterium]
MDRGPRIDPKTIYRLAAGGVQGEIRLSDREWKVLAQVNGVRSVAEIARRVPLAPAELAETLLALAAAGLIEKCERPEVPAAALVDAATLGTIETAFARLVGPLARVLLEEAIEGLGETPAAFPRHQLPALIEALAQQIADETKRVGFQQAMLELLRRA